MILCAENPEYPRIETQMRAAFVLYDMSWLGLGRFLLNRLKSSLAGGYAPLLFLIYSFIFFSRLQSFVDPMTCLGHL